jgi:hypothetical protein
VLGVLAVLAALIALPAWRARSALAAGRARLVEARDAFAARDVQAASDAFAAARARFIAAAAEANNPLLRAVGAVPGIGRSVDVVSAMATSGQRIAEAGGVLSDTVASLPDGLATFAPSGHRLPIDALSSIADAVGQAADLSGSARDLLAGTSTGLLLPPVADARELALGEISTLATDLDRASVIAQRLPAMLGADGPRTYLFGGQNPAEIRGTGGLVGVYSVMTADHGRLSFGEFEPDSSAPRIEAGSVPPPNADYGRIYGQFGGQTSWSNFNMTADGPSAAAAVESMWEADGRGELDGVILADPFALAAMLKATGPVQAPSLDTTLTADNVVAFVTNGAYTEFSDSFRRKTALGDATRDVTEAFLRGTSSPQAAIAAMTSAFEGGHLRMYVDDRRLERVFAQTSIGGALPGDGGDFLAVSQNNAAANKLDFYLKRTVDYSVALGGDGTASANVDVTLANDAPVEGAPRIVIGPYPPVSAVGENVSFVSTYCATTCRLTGKDATGDVQDYGGDVEQGHPFTWDYVRIASGETASLEYRTATTDAWSGDEFGGTYRLTFLNQPTIRPTHVRIAVTVPDGMEIETATGMRISGRTAVWEGIPERELSLEIRFRPSPVKRALLYAWHLVTFPVIRW